MKTVGYALMIAAALAVAAGASPAWAGGCGEPGCCDATCDGGCCASPRCCGCGSACAEPVCCLVRSEHEVVVECYGVKCKEICVPKCGSNCGCVECVTCGECSCDTFCGVTKAFYGTGKPGCGKPKCVKELVKYEMTKKVPTYKWEVRYLCPRCAQRYANGGCLNGDGCESGCRDGRCSVGGVPAAPEPMSELPSARGLYDQAYAAPPVPSR